MLESGGEALVARSLRLPGDRSHYGELVDALERFGTDSGCRDDAWHEFVTAVVEIGGNILSYAYPAPGSGEVEVSLLRFSDRLEARFRDWGCPFAEPDLAPPDPDDLDAVLALAERGRGLMLARAALDRLEYDRTATGENRWHLTKQT